MIWFTDSFSHYTPHTFGVPGVGGTGRQLLDKWGMVWNNSQSFGGYNSGNIELDPFYAHQQPGSGLRLLGNGWGPYKVRPGTPTDVADAGMDIMFESIPGNGAIILIADGMGYEQVSMRGDGNGHLTVTRNGTVLATSTNIVTTYAWYHVELHAKIHASLGTYELRINGSNSGWIAPATGQNTRATANNQYTGIAILGGCPLRVANLYFADGLGAVNNGFIGPQIVTALHPTAPGHYAQWTPNGAQNHVNVNGIYPNDGSLFNQDTVAGHIDTFKFPASPIAAGAITAIQHVILTQQDAGAQRTIQTVQRSGETDYTGAAQNANTSPTDVLDVWQVNPATGAAYTPAEFTAAEFGYKLVS